MPDQQMFDLSQIPGLMESGDFFLTPEGEQVAQLVRDATRQQELDLAADVLATFATHSGKRVWTWLWTQIVVPPSFDASLGYENGVANGFARDGQKALVLRLHQMKAVARSAAEFQR